MKKTMSLMLGLALAFGSVAAFAQGDQKKEDTKKEGKKKGGKKKEGDPPKKDGL